MNVDAEVDLEVLEGAIAADIHAQFPDLKTVEFYREDRKSIPTPAVLLELVEWERSEEDDPLTEQLAILASFEAEVIIGFRANGGRKAKSQIRALASALAAWMHNRRWDKPGAGLNDGGDPVKLRTGPVQIIGAYPDDFAGIGNGEKSKSLDQFEIWRVTWQQKITIGKSVWNYSGPTPTALFYRETVQPFPVGPVELYEEGVQGE